MDYETLNHSKWECKYHVVFIPKYRRKVLFGTLRQHLGNVFRALAEQKESSVSTTGVTATPIIKDLMTAPLARWFRWQLTASGTFSGAWDITFRLFVAAHRLKGRRALQG